MCAKTQMSDYNFSCIFFILLCMRRHNLIRAMCIESRHLVDLKIMQSSLKVLNS